MATDKEIQKELEEISPVLSRLPNTTPYTAPPAGYFEQLPSSILTEIKQAKVVGISRSRNTWRIAVAAAVAGVMIVGGWLYLERQSPSDRETLAANTSISSVQKDMQQISDSEMVDYEDGNDVVDGEEVTSVAQIKDEDIGLVLADVSDQELQQYLDQDDVSAKLN